MKLLIVDDHTLFRDALVLYVKRDNRANEVALAQDFYQAKDILKEDSDFDLILLDLQMPGMEDMAGFTYCKEHCPDVKVALMSGVAESEDVKKAMDMGAAGYFPKTMSGKAFLGAINVVLAGEKFLPVNESVNDILPSYYADFELKSKHSTPGLTEEEALSLTAREKDVLNYLVKGFSNKEIARKVDLQESTIKRHVRSICSKLNVKNRTQIALKASKFKS